jgi:DNA-binding LacI/PurR family transcriptional regulator
MFDGLIFNPLALGGTDLRNRPASTPVVLLGERVVEGGFDHVMIDNVAAAELATRHLIDLGRQRIAAIGDQFDETRQTGQLRTQGYRSALRAAGREVVPSLVRPTEYFHRADGAAAMEDLLALPSPPDAVFCYNDLLALGAMRTILSHGLRVPEDIALIGFDDIEDGRYSTPSLTTIRPNKTQIAENAVRLLLQRLDGNESPPAEIVADYELVPRESTLGRAPTN